MVKARESLAKKVCMRRVCPYMYLSLCIRFFVAEFLRCNLLQAQTLAASFIQKDRPNNPNI